MTILHIIDELKTGGAQTHLLTIVKEMRRQHPDDLQIIGCLFEDEKLSLAFKEAGCEVHIFDFRHLFRQKKYFKIIGIIRDYIRHVNPDVVETHLTWSRLLANTAACFERVPKRIGFEQGDIYMKSPTMRIGNFISQFMFHRIIVCSNSLKEWVNKTHKISKRKMTVMTNCVDLSLFQPMHKNFTGYFGVEKPACFMFVGVGTLGKGVNKRFDIIIKALAECRNRGLDVGLIVCGDGSQRVELEEMSKKMGIDRYVWFLGMRNDIPKILAQCDVFCHAAPYEPFGIVCIEAMACGLPVIVPDSGGIKDIPQNNVDGFLYKSLDYHDLSEKMTKISQNPELAKEMGRQALNNVKKYDVSIYVNQLYSYYLKKSQILY